MNSSIFPVVFCRQLRFWTFHCMMNSLPSMLIAMTMLGLWRKPAAITAMFAAIGTFIFLYAALTSLDGPLADENHVLSRALRLGSKIRAWISGISLFMFFHPS